MCACVRVRACVRARGWVGTCAGGVRFSNSNRIIPSDYRILLLLKMPIPTVESWFLMLVSESSTPSAVVVSNEVKLLRYCT